MQRVVDNSTSCNIHMTPTCVNLTSLPSVTLYLVENPVDVVVLVDLEYCVGIFPNAGADNQPFAVRHQVLRTRPLLCAADWSTSLFVEYSRRE